MKWYWFQTYVLWPISIIFYTFIYFMFDKIDLQAIPFDTGKISKYINTLIPINIFLSLLLIYFFHNKKSLSIQFFIISHIILVIISYLFLTFQLISFLRRLTYFLILFTLIEEKKSLSIKSKSMTLKVLVHSVNYKTNSERLN